MKRLTDKEAARQFLLAWWDSVQYMSELVQLIAETINTPPENILYMRLNRGFVYPKEIKGTDWKCGFHGLTDCSVTHKRDGRHLEIPFGLNSRYDHVRPWHAMQYIMSSTTPWPEYTELKAYLADSPPPYNHLSGSHAKMVDLSKKFEKLPLFQKSDANLASTWNQLLNKRTKERPAIPRIGNPRKMIDLYVSDWLVLNDLGQELINLGLPKENFYRLWKEAGLE